MMNEVLFTCTFGIEPICTKLHFVCLNNTVTLNIDKRKNRKREETFCFKWCALLAMFSDNTATSNLSYIMMTLRF